MFPAEHVGAPLFASTSDVAAGLRPDPLAAGELGLITRGAALQAGAETSVLASINGNERVAEVVCAWGVRPGRDGLPPPLPADGFVGRALEFERAVAEPIDPERDPSLGVTASGVRLSYAAGVAVRPPRGPRGALCLGFAAPPATDLAVTLWVLEAHAWLAALCLHDTGALDGLLAAARFDGLTGCLNQSAIRAEMAREIRRAERSRRDLACCFVDLDNFKGLNDRYGHVHGSNVLAEVARSLRGGVRHGDSVGRYGGDEFVVLLPEADEETAYVLAERIRETICALQVDGAHVPLDVSIGVAQWRAGMAADQLLEAADGALLEAKALGGGGVLIAGSASGGRRSPGHGLRLTARRGSRLRA